MKNNRLVKYLLLFIFSNIFNCSTYAVDKVNIKIDVDMNSKSHNVDKLISLAKGGFTPSYKPNGKMISALANDGFKIFRIINTEWDHVVSYDGAQVTNIRWSRKLERELRKCKELNLKPHIIIGQIVPKGLQKIGEGSQRRGVFDWKLYEQYIYQLANHVVDDWGFKNVVWEVGNEMDNPKFNWVPEVQLKEKLDPRGYEYYLNLYKFITKILNDFRSENNVSFLIGGPALTQNSMNHPEDSPKNWLTNFAKDIVKHNIVCDFLSMHYYGSASNRPELKLRINILSNILNNKVTDTQIWITEWGASAFFQFENENFQTNAGAFGLDFIKTVSESGVDNTIFIASTRHENNEKSGPALLLRDGSKSYAYIALDLLSRLEGELIKCTSDNAETSCFATSNNNKIHIIIWNTDWSKYSMGNRKRIKSRLDSYLSTSILVENSKLNSSDNYYITYIDSYTKYGDFKNGNVKRSSSQLDEILIENGFVYLEMISLR